MRNKIAGINRNSPRLFANTQTTGFSADNPAAQNRILSAIILQIRQFLINIPFFAVFAGCTFQTKTVSDKFHIASFPRKNRLFAIGFQLVSLKISRQNIRTVRIHLIQNGNSALLDIRHFHNGSIQHISVTQPPMFSLNIVSHG